MLGSGSFGSKMHAVSHRACWHDPGRHKSSISACVRFVYTQPVALLHVSIVHGLPSLHTVRTRSHTPVVVLHVYVLHKSFGWHVTVTSYEHVLLLHVSVVHALLSLHTSATSAAVLDRVTHPLAGSQDATRHWSAVVHVAEMLVYTHAPLSHVSAVHALLSLHSAAISVGVLGFT
jgi:hypothetical protein